MFRYIWASSRENLSGCSDQLRLKTACSATETSWGLEISAIARRGNILSRQRTTKVLIRLRGCIGWSAPLLFAYGKNWFSHDVAQIILSEIAALPHHVDNPITIDNSFSYDNAVSSCRYKAQKDQISNVGEQSSCTIHGYRVKDKQWSDTDTIRSNILPSKPKGK